MARALAQFMATVSILTFILETRLASTDNGIQAQVKEASPGTGRRGRQPVTQRGKRVPLPKDFR
jgi:hypothetical protein